MTKLAAYAVTMAAIALAGVGVGVVDVAARSTEFTLVDRTERTKTIEGDGTRATLWSGDGATVLIDVKSAALGRTFAAFVNERAVSLSHVVLTSAIAAQAGAADRFTGATRIATEAADRRLRADGASGVGLALSGGVVLRLAGGDLRIDPVGPALTDGDLVVHLLGERMLVVGDLVTPGLHPRFVAELGGSLRGWLAALRTLHRRHVEAGTALVVPANGDVGGVELLAEHADYLQRIVDTATAAHERGRTVDEMLQDAADLREAERARRGGDLDALLRAAYREVERG